MIRSIGKNVTAQFYNQFVTLAIQLCSVPFLLSAWGVEKYGVWILLTAIPSYIAFSDFGFTFVAKNDMAIRVSRGDREGALVTFQSILLLLVGISATLFSLIVALVISSQFSSYLNIGSEAIDTARIVLLAQFASVLLYQFFLLCCAGVRCEGRPATETYFAASSRLFESLAIVTGAFAGLGLAGSAILGLTVRVVALVAIVLWLRKTTPWLIFSFSKMTIERLRELSSYSLTYMLIPISNALLIQGPVVILGVVSTPMNVAIYAVTRTVARLGMSGANLVNFAFAPEYSFAFGRGDREKFRSFLNIHFKLMAVSTLAYIVVLGSLGRYGVTLLTHAKVTPVDTLIWLMVASVSLEMLWSTILSPLSALNSHRSISIWLAGIGLVSVAISGIYGPNVYGFSIALCVAHGSVLVVSAINFKKIYETSISRIGQ